MHLSSMTYLGFLVRVTLKSPASPSTLVDFGIGQDFDIGMPITFDELGRFDAHGAVIGGKSLVELGHLAADGRRFLDQIDLVSCGGKIERGLNTADPATDDHDISHIAVCGIHETLAFYGLFFHFSMSSSDFFKSSPG